MTIKETIPEKHFECDICSKYFKSKYALKHHTIASHRDHKGIQTFRCDLCDKQFVNHHAFKEHNSVQHDNIKRFKCSYCDKEFYRTDHLKHHIDRKHVEDNKKHVCDIPM